MNEQIARSGYMNGKPVNINISFNIGRKQVTQNISNSNENKDKTICLNGNNLNSNLLVNQFQSYSNQVQIHSVSHPYHCQSKTPELPATDRHAYSNPLDFQKNNLQLKKKNKLHSGDYFLDKAHQIPVAPHYIEKYSSTHKRGFTAAIPKKNTSNNKSKRQSNNYLKHSTFIPISVIADQSRKLEAKRGKTEKNLNFILNKLINNELSKRSLGLASAGSKSKSNNQSACLTSRKTIKKSHKKHKINLMQNGKPFQIQSAIQNLKQQAEVFKNSKIIQKLNNFKSNENSLLLSQIDNIEDRKQYDGSEGQRADNKIIINTDQSIQCIDEIHNWENIYFKENFFQYQDQIKPLINPSRVENYSYKGIPSNSETLMLIQTYIGLLNTTEQDVKGHQTQIEGFYDANGSINSKKNIQNGDEGYHLSKTDFRKGLQAIQSRNTEKQGSNFLNSEQMIKKSQKERAPASEIKFQVEKKIQNAKMRLQNQNQKLKSGQKLLSQNYQPYQIQNDTNSNQSEKVLHLHKSSESSDHLKPFISSEMGQQIYCKDGSSHSERVKINQLKKHQIQKWGYLLEYIKSNINTQTDTQQVLEQVYSYLSKAKVDLIKEGQKFTETQKNSFKKQKLEDQFTNKLSSLFDKSQDYLQKSNEGDYPQKLSKAQQSFQLLNNQNKNMQKTKRLKSQQQQILNEEAQSFKQDYESETGSVDIKFMNLSTIEIALKNQFNQLRHKKEKQIQKLVEMLDQRKICQNQYEEKKALVQKQFKKQTNEIANVKKNLWKGYNEAKQILDKSYITTRIEEQFRNQVFEKQSNYFSNKKGKKMMKCLSESYLNKKKIDYKRFIEEEEKKRLENEDYRALKRQEDDQGKEGSYNSDVDFSHEHSDYYSNFKDSQSQSKDKVFNSIPSSNKNENYQNSESLRNSQTLAQSQTQTKIQTKGNKMLFSPNESVDDEFEKISKKLNKLKQQHEEAIAQQYYKFSSSQAKAHCKQKNLYNSSQINQFGTNQIDEKRFLERDMNSPAMVSISPESSVHYEQFEKSLHTESNEGQKSDKSSRDGDFIEEEGGFGEVKHSDDQNDYYYDSQYEEQEKIIVKELTQRDNLTIQMISKSNQPENSLQGHRLLGDEQLKPKKSQLKVSKETQSLQHKLKYLTDEDREDIFQFIFLDLCIELYQEPCDENKIMNSINVFVVKQHEMSKKKKGVKTNLNVIKDYIRRFCGYLTRTNKSALNNLNVPMGPTAFQMLKYMHQNDQYDEELPDGEDGVVTLIIPVNVFDTFEKSILPTLEFQKYYENEEKELQRVNFLKNILHIHNKALFDSLNQFLDQQRPFGIWGKPFPWKKPSSFIHIFTQTQQQQKLKKSAEKVVEACSYVCGLMIDKQQSLIGNAKISQNYIEQIREDRISRMLANEMIENEERWVFYDDEETEVLVETGGYVYSLLLRQVLEEMITLGSRKS